MSSIKVILLVFLATTSCRKNNRPESETKVNNSKSGFAALCQRLDVRKMGRSMWPGIGTTVGGISAQNAAQKAFPSQASQPVIEQFSKVQKSVSATSSNNTKGKRENILSLFWSQEELNEAFKKGCGGFKDGADTCLVEMMKDLDGEFMTKKGLVRAGIEIKKFEADELNNCALRTQEAEFKAGLCIPLAPASLIAAGGLFGLVNLYLDFGIRVESETNLSNKTILKDANPMFECGAQCDLPFLKAELAFTEEGFKFEKQVTVNTASGVKNLPLQSRSETNISYSEMSEWMNSGWKEVKLKNLKEYLRQYYEKQKKYWNETDPELTRWPELMCESGCY